MRSGKQTVVDGITFDSQTEAEYYEYLKTRDDVESIKLQPQYILMDEFKITCSRCDLGYVTSEKTGKIIKCKTCKGTGLRNRQAWTYTADFEVLCHDGRVQVIDVKGFANERFPLVRKMFEYQNGYELLVVKKTKTGWRYV
ncbi:uncharacterized protein DUF1064 [Bacillus oleivorans]|uniref:Uncharacterized protein DUF1064 n=1 Tax=Bacillus oleivorans TaxID=1448271 RepID=A0A285D9X9_9BACI|nr:DUF1064 domain-containing protein [Bacillus oleivorans]SNX75953.1 uncharacterized protein DUF1064 [Bacillus oleivorans]